MMTALNFFSFLKKGFLSPTEYKVLFALLEKTKKDGKIFVKKIQLAEELKVQPIRITNAIKTLEKYGVLDQIKTRFSYYFELNPDFFRKPKEK